MSVSRPTDAGCAGARPLRRRLVLAVLAAGFAPVTYAAQAAQHEDAIRPATLAVVVNTDDPLSIAIGEYYVAARRIPAANLIRVSFTPQVAELTTDEFSRIKAQVDAAVPRGIQAYALTWAAPYRAGCMSITTAFAFGYDATFCANGCQPTRPSWYFNNNTRAPWSDLRIRPAMMLAGRNFAEVKALIDRGVAADGTMPHGKAYLLSTSDAARNARAPLYAAATATVRDRIEVVILKQDVLQNRSDVLFYFTGLVSVPALDTLGFEPGAIADHLTSFGGQLTDSPQMSALRWLEAGATASYGTVVEPCAFPQKFPQPAIVIGRYLNGETLIEAYWKSVRWPGQGVFVGEPLATPFRLPFR